MEEEDFTSMASHAFLSLLAVIDGNAQRMIASGGHLTAPELLDRTHRIRGAVRGMIQLVDELVAAPRSTAGHRCFRYEPAATDLTSVLREVCELQRELVPDAQIRLLLGDEPIRIWGDAALLRQLFGNIVSNAVRYSTGAADVTVSLGKDGEEVTVLVEDRGIGIAPDERQNIFEPYFRGRNAAGIVGQGLGLYVVKKLVDLHHGTVTASGRDERGAAFVVRLPRSAPIS